ncbi:hypothetical protein EYZ11_003618 [Aspergillus tanneri]|uniref:Zn(2)-C6 fungal-type domain-containing protein n=1 Tax=Aspergillus tanneri TaxID=1220188 RepID=A0A4S3JTB8_9EURO|nr:uncharacterized protein ATNIH1004_006548 [Aspergillus tanneri]KAA8647846.1 hypothetical protein ATNIH1004_006548 [Aspergillus tanneri]THC96901.1 hypothetical protein EYZ11_003618 [Aspergillus tanneri]
MSLNRKRKAETLTEESGHRQPRTSCDFCRVKKLKCDRQQPCSSCAARGVKCVGQSTPPLTNPASDANQDLLLRVRRLEQAVFEAPGAGFATPNRNTDALQPALRQPIDVEGDHPLNRSYSGGFNFCIQKNSEPLQDGPYVDPPRTVWLPPREEAFALLDDFVQNSLPLNRIISEVSARFVLHDVYSRLERAQEVKNDHVAFTLAICADSAFYLSQGARPSENEAGRQSYLWRQVSWELLDHSQRAGGSSLEGLQAMMILEDVFYSLEGGSARWKYLLSSALATARELSLHLIDGPAYENRDDSTTQEVKRRVWWHLVGTDWLASCASGSLDRTYTVNPQHMAVHYPRNINDSDLPVCDQQPPKPIDTPTDMSILIARIRLAEVCREVADLLAATHIEHLHYDQVLRIDYLTEEVRHLFPPPCALHTPLPLDTPPLFHRMRQAMHLALESRRARLFRPFIQSGVADRDHRFLRFRTACLRSAQAVMHMASDYLGGAPWQSAHLSAGAQTYCPPRLPRYSAVVIRHLFQACTVMAADPSLAGTKPSRHPDVECRRRELAESSRLLERVSEQSPMAADLVGKLIGVLKRYSVQSVHVSDQDGGRLAASTTAIATADAISKGSASRPTVADQLPMITVPLPPSTHDMTGLTWGGVTPGSLELDGFGGLWGSMVGNPSATDDWGQVFTDLDHWDGPV